MEILSCFDGNGNLLDKGTLKNGNGTINKFDIDGTLIKEVNYVDGKEKN
jgi:antitoxin component YwqK of YwqJK toxin-antitoxin module